ncbi:MAG: hypothetical protein RSN61_21395 [Chryseobacterium sp.]|uniref:hypothetical protein n=1 Tax=Chryseobacterium sp. TaxID=1871047 RepID=UPI002FC9FE87
MIGKTGVNGGGGKRPTLKRFTRKPGAYITESTNGTARFNDTNILFRRDGIYTGADINTFVKQNSFALYNVQCRKVKDEMYFFYLSSNGVTIYKTKDANVFVEVANIGKIGDVYVGSVANVVYDDVKDEFIFCSSNYSTYNAYMFKYNIKNNTTILIQSKPYESQVKSFKYGTDTTQINFGGVNKIFQANSYAVECLIETDNSYDVIRVLTTNDLRSKIFDGYRQTDGYPNNISRIECNFSNIITIDKTVNLLADISFRMRNEFTTDNGRALFLIKINPETLKPDIEVLDIKDTQESSYSSYRISQSHEYEDGLLKINGGEYEEVILEKSVLLKNGMDTLIGNINISIFSDTGSHPSAMWSRECFTVGGYTTSGVYKFVEYGG